MTGSHRRRRLRLLIFFPPPPPSDTSLNYHCKLTTQTSIRNQMLRREIEKKRIREQIIAEEIAWRQSLEAEVRRELMMEREMAVRVEGLSFEERPIMRPDPGLSFPFTNQFNNLRLEEGPAFPGRKVFYPPLQPPWLSEALVAPEAKPSSEDNEHKSMGLAKPDSNLCGAKWKAATLAGLSKKPKEEWSCALCQVSATSERGLKEHLQGKKHKAEEERLKAMKKKAKETRLKAMKKKAKEARLKAMKKMAQKPSILPLLKVTKRQRLKAMKKMVQKPSILPLLKVTKRQAKLKIQKPSILPSPRRTKKQAKLTSSTGGSELEAEVEGMLQVENRDDTDKKIGSKEDAENGNDKMSRQQHEHTKKLKKNGTEKLQKEQKTAEFGKKKSEFWCEMCQISAPCAMGMEDHKKGKKHAARLKELDRNVKAASQWYHLKLVRRQRMHKL